MIVSKKYYLMILYVISCSIQTIAQTGYYYKGKLIPLDVNENKVVVSIPKDCGDVIERFHGNVQTWNEIRSETFDSNIILRSEYEKLTSQDFWIEDSKSVILTSSYFTENDEEVFATPSLNVRLKKEDDIDLLTSYAERYKLTIVKNMPTMPLWYILHVTPESEKSPMECANEIYESGDFAESIADFTFDAMACSNDPLFNQQWGLHNNSYTGIDISATSAWNYATGKNVKIAIIDTGVDSTHVDLAANISSLSYDTETGTSPSIFYKNKKHGTHCAGIAAAVKDNGIQIAGVAPEATIISISNLLEFSDNLPFRLADGINWAYQHGADIISNSWRCHISNSLLEESIRNAFRYGRNGKGCVVVFATGNNRCDSINYPANCNDTILAVGAIDSTGVRYSYSNYGPGLDLVAPGVGVLSTLPNDSTGYMDGTSMACPHVAGVAALILERNSELTVTQVNSIINSSAKKLSGVNFNITKPDGSWNNEYGYGLVDAYSSVINTPSTAYIQNETVTGTRIISAENIYVGRDVTNTKQYGDVTLGQGDITIKAGYVEIKNSTTVPLGTTLKIEN